MQSSLTLTKSEGNGHREGGLEEAACPKALELEPGTLSFKRAQCHTQSMARPLVPIVEDAPARLQGWAPQRQEEGNWSPGQRPCWP